MIKVSHLHFGFEQAIQRDLSKAYLFLDLSIYHTFRAMRAGKTDKELFQKSVAAGDAAISRYLDSEPIRPMQAYALGVRAKYRFFSAEKEQGQEFIRRAKALDPYFSKATGAPAPDQFILPDEVSRTHHRSLDGLVKAQQSNIGLDTRPPGGRYQLRRPVPDPRSLTGEAGQRDGEAIQRQRHGPGNVEDMEVPVRRQQRVGQP